MKPGSDSHRGTILGLSPRDRPTVAAHTRRGLPLRGARDHQPVTHVMDVVTEKRKP